MLPIHRLLPSSRAVQKADRKSTRLNSSHQIISYPDFCLKKKHHASSNIHPTSAQWSKAIPAALRFLVQYFSRSNILATHLSSLSTDTILTTRSRSDKPCS